MKFTWDYWNFDGDGGAFIIAKKVCPLKEDVPQFIIDADGLHNDCKSGMVVEDGWCKWQVRTDWENLDGEPAGGYVVQEEKFVAKTLDLYGKRKRGWFPVWIVRKEDWY